MAETTAKNEYLTYKGKPLVRCGNELYYGSMSDKFIIHMMITESKKAGNVDMPTKVTVQLMYTDPDIRPKDKVTKTSEKESLYKAMEIAGVWLERALG